MKHVAVFACRTSFKREKTFNRPNLNAGPNNYEVKRYIQLRIKWAVNLKPKKILDSYAVHSSTA